MAFAQIPTPDFTSNITNGCYPITVTFNDLSTNSPTSWVWDFGNGNFSSLQNPSAVYSTPGPFTVKLTACNGSGCDSTIKFNYIIAFNYPIANFTASSTFGCTPLNIAFTDLTTPSSSSIVSWFWDFGDGDTSTLQNPIHQYAIDNLYDVSISVTDANGCNDSKSVSDYITAATPPSLSYTVDDAYACTEPLTVNFTNTTTLGSYPISSWLWDFGDASFSTDENPTHTYTTNGSFHVQITATDNIGCVVGRLDSNVIVVGTDSAYFSYTSVRTCTSLDVSFVGTANPNITSWSWDFGDSSPTQSGQNVSHLYTTSGNFIVTLTTVNVASCSDVSTQTISFQMTSGGFTTDTTYACSLPFTVAYSGTVLGNSPFTWAWDFSYESTTGFMNQSPLQNPSYTYFGQDTFDVMMVVADVFGCTDTLALMPTDSIWIERPVVNFFASPSQGCTTLVVAFTDISFEGMGTIVSWDWDFDDPDSGVDNISSLQNPGHDFDSLGEYFVSLTVTNSLGCIDSGVSIVRTGYPPVADSIVVPVDTACHGELLVLTAFSADTNVNGAYWYFGDATSGGGWPDVMHDFQDTGLLVMYCVPSYNGCQGDTIYDSIYIRPPKPIFTAVPSFICRTPASVTFTNTSWEADSSSWDFGDGSALDTTSSPVHVYADPGRYKAVLTVTNDNGCMDSTSFNIDVPQPTAGYSATPTLGCVPLDVQFTDTSFTFLSSYYPLTSWSWDFGDGNFSSLRNPVHTYTTAGIFTVKLVLTDNMGCVDSVIHVDEVITSTSTAEYSATPTVGCEGLTVNFTDLSTQYSPILGWSWDFGDSSPLSTAESPSHTYATAGSYDVALTITDSIGCVNTMNKTPFVFITKPSPQFTHQARVCEDAPFNFVNSTAGSGLTFLWDFGNGDTATVNNPTHTYPDSGWFTVTLTATDTNGCPNIATSPIRSVGLPSVNFVLDTLYAVCPPFLVQFSDLSTSVDDSVVGWVWDFGDTNYTIAQNPIHTFTYPGDFDIELVVTNSTGCTDSLTIPDLVAVAGPSGYFTFTPSVICIPNNATVSFTATTNNVDIYTWDFGDGNIDTIYGDTTITHTYTSAIPGFPIPQLSITDSGGCKLSATPPTPDFVTIDELVVDFYIDPDTLYTPFCPSDTVFFSDSSYSINDSANIIFYLWDFGDFTSSTDSNATHVYTSPGTYVVTHTVLSDLSCFGSSSQNVVIVLVDSLVLKSIMTDSVEASCYGGSDGQATADGLSGTSPYTFLWEASAASQTTATATGLMAGVYSVTVSDANGCTDSRTVTVGEPAEPGVTIDNVTDASCFGFSDGSITVSATGGTPGYVYQWDAASGNQTGQVATGLAAGVYVVVVTDTNGCVFSDSATVSEPTQVVILTDSTDVLCFGGNTGTATANPSGGSPGYAYLWGASAGSQTTATATGLIAGTYTVVVTDSNLCVDSAVATVVEPVVLSSSDSVTNVSCFGFSDGIIDVTVSGGVMPYTYQWDASAGSQTTAIATGLIAGTYTLVVTDSNDCQYFDTVAVTEPTEIIITVTTTDALCNGDSNGTATASPVGGVPGYVYLWGASAASQTTATATGLSAGSHSVTVTDTTGCSDSTTATVIEPTILVGTTGSITDVSCFGFSDGDITVSASGGLPLYTYQWDVAAGSQTTAQATGLVAGVYTYTISDSNACPYTDSATVAEPVVLVITTDSTDVLCFGGNTGTATANPSGGSPGYAYLWDASAGSQTTATATGLIVGTYSVTVTDSNTCVDSAIVIVIEPTVLSAATDSVTDASCNGAPDGSISVSGTGGMVPYAFLWDTAAANQITATAVNLSAGVYTVVVTDSNGCGFNVTDSITEPPAIVISTSTTDAICNGDSNGTATVIASGGMSGYVYQWGTSAGSQTTTTATGLSFGSHIILVTDSTGCTDSTFAIVNEPLALGSTIDSTFNASCFGFSDGSITISGSGGIAPYVYQWGAAAASQTTAQATALTVGVYSFTITDSNACVFTDSATITEPIALSISTDSTDVLCFGDSTGTATANPAGGTSPYFYQWNDTQTQATQTATALAIGIWSVTVTDDNGCVADTQITVVEPLLLEASIIEVMSNLCFGDSVGELDAQAVGGVPTYSYSWSPGTVVTQTATGLMAGDYILTITDSNNCQAMDTATITELTPMVIDLDSDGMDTVCYNVGYLMDAQISGSVPPYTYDWTSGTSSDTGNPVTVTPDTIQTWTVTVTDSVGCSSSDTIKLFMNFLQVNVTAPDTVCYGEITTIAADASGTLSGVNMPYTYQWNASQSTSSSMQAGIFTSSTFVVTVTDGCSKPIIGSKGVGVFTFPDIDIQTSSLACPGVLMSFTDAINSVPGATHVWHFGDGDSATGLSVLHAYPDGGEYVPYVTVTTPIGCARTVTSSIPVVVYSTPGAWFDANPWVTTLETPNINFTDLSVVIPVQGDVIDSYEWEFGDGVTSTEKHPSHVFPSMGTFPVTLTVTSNYGCVGEVTRNITIDPPFIDLLIPTAFTPNPSGSSAGSYDPSSFDNDVFYPITTFVVEFNMQIYNRWGELIFESTNLDVGWDGYYRDKLSQQDTYIWKMKIVWITGKEYEDVGRIMLVR